MTDFDKNAQAYLQKTKAQLENNKKLDKYVHIPFYASRNGSSNQVFLNKALDADLINPNTATEQDYKSYPLLDTNAVITSDGAKTEMIRRPAEGEKCFIDWLSITMQADTFADIRTKSASNETLKQKAIIDNVSKVLNDLFGFAVEIENKNGRNFYERSFNLHHNSGFICIGGQSNTVMITINGTGCTYGKHGWESHLHAWLNLFAPTHKITRIDLAHDDLKGDYSSIDWFNNQHTLGGFTNGGRPPKCEYRGDWKRPSGKGRTLYIGSRDSGKFCRIYEKGRQLGDVTSEWVRCEVEYKSRDIYIPSEVLINPSQYFLATYPCFHIFDIQTDLAKFERIDKQDLMTFEQAMSLVVKQYGRYLHFFRRVFDDDKALLDALTDIQNTKIPERIDTLTIPKLSHN